MISPGAKHGPVSLPIFVFACLPFIPGIKTVRPSKVAHCLPHTALSVPYVCFDMKYLCEDDMPPRLEVECVVELVKSVIELPTRIYHSLCVYASHSLHAALQIRGCNSS